jgi:hypothetical protein
MCVAEGLDIRPPVIGAPIEFKRTVVDAKWYRTIDKKERDCIRYSTICIVVILFLLLRYVMEIKSTWKNFSKTKTILWRLVDQSDQSGLQKLQADKVVVRTPLN